MQILVVLARRCDTWRCLGGAVCFAGDCVGPRPPSHRLPICCLHELLVSFYSCRILYSVFRNHPYYRHLKACELVDAIPASVGAPSVSALVDVMKATFALHTSWAYSINGVHPDHRFLLPVAPAIHRLALQT